MPAPASRSSRLLPRAVVGTGAASLALLLGAATPTQAAASGCRAVRGSYVEHLVTRNCTSPVNLCIAGTYSGQIRGDFEGSATSVIQTIDTRATGAAMFTSNSRIDASFEGRRGRLIIKNAGAFAATGGSIVDLQTIVGGTDELAGATGALRAEGTFAAATGGMSRYEGTVCLP
jgi:Protein of unknown function (DUF3224)